jgi:hypothetical protein
LGLLTLALLLGSEAQVEAAALAVAQQSVALAVVVLAF